MDGLKTIYTNQIKEAYQRNGRIFARHSDLIRLLGWNRERYTKIAKDLIKTKGWLLESGSPNGLEGDFPILKANRYPCFSIREVRN